MGALRGVAVGNPRCDNGAKISEITDGSGFAVAAYAESATPHGVKLAEDAID